MRDIAGCRVEFTNPLPEALPLLTPLAFEQKGVAGEFTASRRIIRAPRIARPSMAVPSGLKNLIFLEWFNEQEQRVVVQSWHWNMRVSAPTWRLTPEQEKGQIKRSRALRKAHLLDRPPEKKAPPMFGTPAPDDPFAPQAPVANPFQESDDISALREPAPPAERLDPLSSSALTVKIAATALASELRDLESLLGVVPRVKAREALLDLMSSISDLSAQLRQTMYQLSTLKPDSWAHLVTDVEQSIPLFSAAASACDAFLGEEDVVHPAWWNNTCAKLRTIVEKTTSLLNMLNNHGR